MKPTSSTSLPIPRSWMANPGVGIAPDPTYPGGVGQLSARPELLQFASNPLPSRWFYPKEIRDPAERPGDSVFPF